MLPPPREPPGRLWELCLGALQVLAVLMLIAAAWAALNAGA